MLGNVIILSCTQVLTQIPGTFENRVIDHEPPDNIWIKSTSDYNGDGDMDIFGSNHGGKEKPKLEIWINTSNP